MVSGCHFGGLILPNISVNLCFYNFSSDDTHTHTDKKKSSGHAKSHFAINLKGIDYCGTPGFFSVSCMFRTILTASLLLLNVSSLILTVAYGLSCSFDCSARLHYTKKTPNPWPKLFVLSPPGVLLATAPTPEHFE